MLKALNTNKNGLLRLLCSLTMTVGSILAANAEPSKLYFPIPKEEVQKETETTLPSKAMVDIIADEINYDQEQSFYEAKGNAETYLANKDATLFADYISYDAEAQLLEATGNIKMLQGTDEIYGNYISFDLSTNEYQVTEPRLYASGIKMKSRKLSSTFIPKEQNKRSKNVLQFNNGTMALAEPISVYAHASRIRTRYGREQRRHNQNQEVDWTDTTDTRTLHYSAEEVYFDNTRKTNNLQIKGARIWLNDNLSIPSPVHITTTVGEAANTRFQGPIFGTQTRIGGFAMGPRFFWETDPGVFSVVPLLQIGNGPNFGVGGIATFNTPNDNTAIMGGYGTLEQRFILNAHQNIWHRYLQADVLVNQFKRNSVFGTSQVGQLYDLSTDFRLKLPFIDERGMRIRGAAGWAHDNNDLFSKERREQLAEERGVGGEGKENQGFRTEIETDFYTQPIWRYGNERYNFSLRTRTQAAFRIYDTGDTFRIARFGPAIEVRIDNLSFELDYLLGVIGGQSPFLFDQFVDGNQAIILDGDYIVNKWLSIGTLLTYSLDRERFTRNQVRTEFGPEDFKIRLSYDTIRNQVGLGFNVIFGDTVDFDTLKVRI